MKKLLFLAKPDPAETPEEFVKRLWQSLVDRGLVDQQGKLSIPAESSGRSKRRPKKE